MPLLCVRPAEMKALEELPERDKDMLFPLMSLRPWTTAHHLDSALSRVEEAYARRPIIFDLDQQIDLDGPRRPVHEEIDFLRVADHGYQNWCDFVTERDYVVPCLQLDEPEQLAAQAESLASLDRGLVVRLRSQQFGLAAQIAEILSYIADGVDVCFLLDHEKQSRELLARAMVASNIADRISAALPGSTIALSASTFPDSFTSITGQDIYERQFFEAVARTTDSRVIYSDRGSARASSQQGGGGAPTPRVDNALAQQWLFFRDDTTDDRGLAYERAAARSITHPGWDGELRLWGSQMIERTALGDRDAISSPARSTAVRINIHLHRQLFYGDDEGLYETDEEWSDL